MLISILFPFFIKVNIQYIPLIMHRHRPIQYFNFRIDRLFSKKQVLSGKDTKKTDEINDDVEDLYVERVRLEKMKLRL
jgi:hypothetical protein